MKKIVYYNKKDLQKIQLIEKNILKEIIRICEQNNLTYATIGGTTLGVIRHKGFIPWDDDIDICMPRDDFEKFQQISISGALKPNYRYMSFYTHKNCPSAFAKVCDIRTTFVENECRGLKDYIHSIWVDIFPLDFFPSYNSKDEKKMRKKIMRKYQLFKSKSLWRISELAPLKRRVIGYIIRPFLRLFLLPISKTKLFNSLQKELQKYNGKTKDSVGIMGGDWFYYNYQDFFPLKRGMFEDIEVNIPNNYDAVLRKQYGDYLILPPESKRHGHVPYKLDLTKVEL